MRLDRLITLGLVSPLRSAFGRLAGDEGDYLPILMYHSISEDPEAESPPYYRVCTPTARFAEQMQWLENLGYRGVTLSEGLAWLKRSEAKGGSVAGESSNRAPSPLHSPSHLHSPQAKPVALTFDDGLRNFHTKAFPILQKHGFSATMYLPTAFIGEQRRALGKRDCLIWDEIRELDRLGVEFGSHTVSHPRLVQRTWPEIMTEIRDSKKEIEQHLSHEVTSFAFPYAFPQTNREFAKQFSQHLDKTGYRSSVTTMLGRTHVSSDSLELPRLPVNSADDFPLLRAKLRGAYDWMASAQIMRKNVARCLRLKDRQSEHAISSKSA